MCIRDSGYTSRGLNDYPSRARFYMGCGLGVLTVDERAHGDSEGTYIGFGCLDRLDAKKWMEYMAGRLGEDLSLIHILDNKTNYVTAIVGGRGADDPFNRAYLSARQPGSTIKPLIDYGPAFDTGEYYPTRMVNDHKWEKGPSRCV